MSLLFDLLASNHTGVESFLALLHLDPLPGRQYSCMSISGSHSTFGNHSLQVTHFCLTFAIVNALDSESRQLATFTDDSVDCNRSHDAYGRCRRGHRG